MGKILLICILIGYLLYKWGSSLMQSSHSNSHQRPNQHRPSGGNVHVDSMPPKEEKKRSGFKGGEYVDYEEIK